MPTATETRRQLEMAELAPVIAYLLLERNINDNEPEYFAAAKQATDNLLKRLPGTEGVDEDRIEKVFFNNDPVSKVVGVLDEYFTPRKDNDYTYTPRPVDPVEKISKIVNKHLADTEHDHDQFDHTPHQYREEQRREKGGFTSEDRRQKFESAREQGSIKRHPGGWRVGTETFKTREEALAAHNRRQMRDIHQEAHREHRKWELDRAEDMEVHEVMDELMQRDLVHVESTDAGRGIFQTKDGEKHTIDNWNAETGEIVIDGQAMSAGDLMRLATHAAQLPGTEGEDTSLVRLIDPKQALSEVAEQRVVQDKDAFLVGVGKLADAHAAGDISAEEYGRMAEAWRQQFVRSTRGVGANAHEVDRALQLATLAASMDPKDDRRGMIQRNIAALQDLKATIGDEAVESTANAIIGSLSSGGRLEPQEIRQLENPDAFLGAARPEQRVEETANWLDQRRNRRERTFREHIQGVGGTSTMGFIIDNQGKVESAYRSGNKGDGYIPFNLRGMRQASGKHIVRGRDRGFLTNSDMLFASIYTPASITVTSPDGTYRVGFTRDFADRGFLDRISLWRRFRAVNREANKLARDGLVDEKGKKVDFPYGETGIALQTLALIDEEFPGTLRLRRIRGPERGSEEFRQARRRRTGGSPVQRALEELKDAPEGTLPSGLGIQHTNERLFQGDPSFHAAIQPGAGEADSIRSHLESLGIQFTPQQERIWREEALPEFEARDEFRRLMASHLGMGPSQITGLGAIQGGQRVVSPGQQAEEGVAIDPRGRAATAADQMSMEAQQIIQALQNRDFQLARRLQDEANLSENEANYIGGIWQHLQQKGAF